MLFLHCSHYFIECKSSAPEYSYYFLLEFTKLNALDLGLRQNYLTESVCTPLIMKMLRLSSLFPKRALVCLLKLLYAILCRFILTCYLRNFLVITWGRKPGCTAVESCCKIETALIRVVSMRFISRTNFLTIETIGLSNDVNVWFLSRACHSCGTHATSAISLGTSAIAK